MNNQEGLETIWEAPTSFAIILEADPPKVRGRKRADPRQMLGIIFRLRSGCQWNRLPKELGDDSTIHRTFQRWVELGVLRRILGGTVRRVGRCGLGMAGGRRGHGQGTFGGDLIGPNPTDRGKAGSKRSLLVEGQGGPLSIVVHCWMRPWRRLWSNVRNSPRMTHSTCAWTRGMTILRVVEPSPDTAIGHTSDRRGEVGRFGRKRYPARRWVVERTLAWLSKCRAVLVRYDKKASNYMIATACVRTPVVPSPMATCHFEIVS